jgi:hypothetical protein
MKTFTTLTAVVALVAGMSIASAQNPGGPAGPSASPSNINKGTSDTAAPSTQSGSQSGGSAMQSGPAKNTRAAGTGKFCVETTKGGGLDCKYADLAACNKDAQPQNLKCSANPNMGTTGSKQ